MKEFAPWTIDPGGAGGKISESLLSYDFASQIVPVVLGRLVWLSANCSRRR
jgi:hypothetical protein